MTHHIFLDYIDWSTLSFVKFLENTTAPCCLNRFLQKLYVSSASNICYPFWLFILTCTVKFQYFALLVRVKRPNHNQCKHIQI